MKRLLIVDGYFHWPPRGGGIRDIAEVGNGLAKDYEVSLLAPRYGFRGWLGYTKGLDFTVETIPFDIASFNGPEVLWRFRKAIRSIGPDIVLIGNGNAIKPYLILASRGHRTYVRLYSYELLCPISHGLLFREGRICDSNVLRDARCAGCMVSHPRRGHYNRELYRGLVPALPLYRRYLRESLKVPEAFIVTSRHMRRRFSEIIDSARMATIPSGLDCSVFSPGQGCGNDLVTIFAAGRVTDPTKGVDALIGAAGSLWADRQDFRVLLAGHGIPKEAGRYVQSLGWVSEERLPSLYRSSDIVCVPSAWAEPFGMVALEGLGSGKPVVASRTGGLPDFVAHGKNGFLFRPGASDMLAGELGRLMDSPALRARMGRAARKTALDYDWSRIVPCYSELLG